MKAVAIIVGAGRGVRMNRETPKQFLLLGGLPILTYPLRAFDTCADIDSIILAVPGNDIRYCREEIIAGMEMKTPIHVIAGGKQRQDSVANGLEVVERNESVVVIHDAVRPFIEPDRISRCIRKAEISGACIVAIPVSDTLKTADANLHIETTVSRENLWLAQTPQAFRYDIIKKAHDSAKKDRFRATDDAALVERMGIKVGIVPGSRRNIKITDPEDLRMAEAMLMTT